MMSVSITSNEQRSSHSGRILVDYKDLNRAAQREIQSLSGVDDASNDNKKSLSSYSSQKKKLSCTAESVTSAGQLELAKSIHLTSCYNNVDDQPDVNSAHQQSTFQNEIITLDPSSDEKQHENQTKRDNTGGEKRNSICLGAKELSLSNSVQASLSAISPSLNSINNKVLIGKRLSLQSTDFDATMSSNKAGNLKRMSAPNFTTIRQKNDGNQKSDEISEIDGESNQELDSSAQKFKRSSVHIIPHKKRTKFELVDEVDESMFEIMDYKASGENEVLEDGDERKTSSREELEFKALSIDNGLNSHSILMRTMTEILTNQLRLTRQIENMNDHFYSFGYRFKGIESKINELSNRLDKSSREELEGDLSRKSADIGESNKMKHASRVLSSPFEAPPQRKQPTPPAPPTPSTSQVFLSTTSPSSYKSIINTDRQPIMKQSNTTFAAGGKQAGNYDLKSSGPGEKDSNDLIHAIAAAAAVAAHQNMNKIENLQSQIPLAKCNSAPMESPNNNNQINNNNNSTSFDLTNKQRLVSSMSLKPNYFGGGSNQNLQYNQHHYINNSNKQHFSSNPLASAQSSTLFQPFPTNSSLSLHSSHNPLRNFDSSNHQFPILSQQAKITQHIQSLMPNNQTDPYMSQSSSQHFASQTTAKQYDHHSIHQNQSRAVNSNQATTSSKNNAALAAAAAVAAAMVANNNASNSTNSSNSISSKNQPSQSLQASTGSILNAVAVAAAAAAVASQQNQDSMDKAIMNPHQFDSSFAETTVERRANNDSESSVSQVSEELEHRSKHFGQPIAKQPSSSNISNSVPYSALMSQRHIPSSLVDQLELSEDVERLVSRDVIKRCIRKAKHRGNFAANLAAELFSKEERIMGNCTGTRGKRQLSPRRLQIVKEITFRMYTNQAIQQVNLKCNGESNLAATTAILQEFEEAWRKECITAIDAKNRSIGRDLIRTSSSSNTNSGGNSNYPSNLSSSANQNGYQEGYYGNNNDDYEDDYGEDIDPDEDTNNNQNNLSINNDDQASEENNQDNLTSNEEEESTENSESQIHVIDNSPE